jgi:hypothetical protein
VLLVGSCWLLLNLGEPPLTGTVTDRHGNPARLAFLEHLGVTAAGALLVATTCAEPLTERPPAIGVAIGATVRAAVQQLRR